ncbi:MAG: M6 family metalloprotease domain-containing protein [Prevotella sp.]
MRHILTTAAAAFLFAASSFAIPAKPGQWRTLRLADGTEVRAELTGDEFCHYWRAADGTAYVATAEQGVYMKADREAVEANAVALRSKANAIRQTRAAEGDTEKFTGKKRGLIILVEFVGKDEIPAKTFSRSDAQAYYDRVANEKGFNDPEVGFKSSVYDYFYAQSDGKFEFNFDVVGPFTLPNTYRTYGANDGGYGTNEANIGKLIYDACRYADKKGDVDFTKYDWDGDGVVDQVFVLYAGQGENTCPDDLYLIWPQEGTLGSIGMDQKPFEMDGVTVKSFACSCELGEGGRLDGIGTICHEFSHCFGLPDMYDKGTAFGATELHYGTYVWDLMNMGNYLDNGYQPAGYTAYERAFCGWKTLTELNETTDVTDMKPLSEGGDAYIIYNDGNRNEYYIIENRQKTGCDGGLYAAGMMISHVNYSAEAWAANDVNTTKERCGIIAADNSWTRTENDVKGDLYPFNGNNALTATTTPAATVVNENKDGSLFMRKDITDITQNADGTMSFRFYNPLSSGIENIQTDSNPVRVKGVYNIAGQRITSPNTNGHGLYIIDGKKILR